MSIAAAALIRHWLLGPNVEILDYLLTRTHLSTLGWLTDPRRAVPTVAAATAWKDLGCDVVVLLAALPSVPGELVEAARIDSGSSGV